MSESMLESILISPVKQVRESLNLDVSTFCAMLNLSTAELVEIEAGTSLLTTATWKKMLSQGFVTDQETFKSSQVKFFEESHVLNTFSSKDQVEQIQVLVERDQAKRYIDKQETRIY